MNLVSLLLLTVELVLLRAEDMYHFPEEWYRWKRYKHHIYYPLYSNNNYDFYHNIYVCCTREHKREYRSADDELQRHMIWLSNKQYIDEFNANDTRGFTLGMNELGDLVNLRQS